MKYEKFTIKRDTKPAKWQIAKLRFLFLFLKFSEWFDKHSDAKYFVD